MSYKIQGLEFEPRITEDSFSVEAYRDSKRLINLFDSYLTRESEYELNDVLTYSDDFMKLTDGIPFEDFKELGSDQVELKRVNKLMAKNLGKYPNSYKVVQALNNYMVRLEGAKESFLSANSIIKNNTGKEIMISNTLLLFQTYLKGEVEKINLNPDKPDETFELIDRSNEILKDFFLSIASLKTQLKISPLTLRVFGLKENQTLLT